MDRFQNEMQIFCMPHTINTHCFEVQPMRLICLHHKHSPTRPLIHYLKLTMQFVSEQSTVLSSFKIYTHENYIFELYHSNIYVSSLADLLKQNEKNNLQPQQQNKRNFYICHKNYQNETGYMSKERSTKLFVAIKTNLIVLRSAKIANICAVSM